MLVKSEAYSLYLGHIACRPPSTRRWVPVVKLASSLARNAIALATSDTSPTLPRACVVLLRSKNCRDENVLESESITSTRKLPVWVSAHYFLHFSLFKFGNTIWFEAGDTVLWGLRLGCVQVRDKTTLPQNFQVCQSVPEVITSKIQCWKRKKGRRAIYLHAPSKMVSQSLSKGKGVFQWDARINTYCLILFWCLTTSCVYICDNYTWAAVKNKKHYH